MVSITAVIVALAAVLGVLVGVVVALAASPTTSSEEEREAIEEPTPSPPPALGGGGLSPPRAERIQLDTTSMRLLMELEKLQALPYEEMMLRLGYSSEVMAKTLRRLEEMGLVRVEGGVVMLTEEGVKRILQLWEKYAEKEKRVRRLIGLE